MIRLENLIMKCPHCFGENPLIGEQRCVECGMNMISDGEQRLRTEKLAPLASALDNQLLLLRTRGAGEASIHYVKKLVSDLRPYTERFPGVSPLLDEADIELGDHPEEKTGRDPDFLINLIILAVLIAIPLVGGMIGVSGTVLFFLWLSALGWAFIGFWKCVKKSS